MMQSDDDLILMSVDRDVASIVLNRPERQNAWTGTLARRYFAALRSAACDPDVRAIVVSGSGGSFCPGGDAEELGKLAAEPGKGLPLDTPSYLLPLTIGKPIIAAIAGPCFGIGLQQALCCDVRLAAEDVKFSTAFVRRGLVAERGTSWLLSRLIGVGRAADLLLSGRVVRAEEAERIGLVNSVVATGDLLDEAMSYARLLVERCSPRAMREIKGQLYRDLTGGPEPAYVRAEALLDDSLKWPDFAEGVASMHANRAPDFSPLPSELGLLDASVMSGSDVPTK